MKSLLYVAKSANLEVLETNTHADINAIRTDLFEKKILVDRMSYATWSYGKHMLEIVF